MKLKSLIAIALSLTVMAACSKFDSLQAQLDEQNARITALEKLCSQMNESIQGLVAITDALAARDYITGVEEVKQDGIVVGYKINFGYGNPITIPFGKDGKSPNLGIKEVDGVWYWTLDGEFLTDDQGNKLRVEGVTPQFKIENGKWYVSYDKGVTWSETGPATADPLIKDIKVTDDNVIFTLSDGTVITLPLNLSDNFNIPYGIVMVTKDLGEIHRGDTTSLFIRVNPSNFQLKEENVDLFVTHDVYSCYSEGPVPETGFPEVFDETVKSEFKYIGLKKTEGQDGVYEVAIVIDGKGNYYDDASIFVLAKNKDSKGEERSVCSATSCIANVTPHLSEAIYVDSSVQSFFELTAERMDTTKVKSYYVGLWSKLYINRAGAKRVYDRTEVTVESVSDTTNCVLHSSKYQNYGLIELAPNVDSDYWKNVMSLRKTQDSYTVSGAVLTLQRASVRGEKAEFPFSFKYFYNSEITYSREYSISRDSLMTKTFTLDYTEFRTKAGYDEFNKPWSYAEPIRSVQKACTFRHEKEAEGFIFSLSFMFNNPTPGKKCIGGYQKLYQFSQGQSANGKFVALEDDTKLNLLYYGIYHTYSLVE